MSPSCSCSGRRGREADRKGTGMVTRVSEAAAAAAREVGFERFPGTAVQE